MNTEQDRLWKEADMVCTDLHPSTDMDHLS
jgi:hypothetical protein